MAQVTVTVNGRNYTIACDDGQEQHLMSLAGELDDHVQRLVSSVGQVGDAHLLVMAGLMLADELADSRTAGPQSPAAALGRPDTAALAALAERVERLAAGLEEA